MTTLVVREWNLMVQGWKSAGPLPTLVSAVVGAILGMLVAFMVICSLVEISLSFFEAVMFGFVLLFVGVFMVWRAMATGEVQPPPLFRAVMGGFGGLVAVSGLCCFMLQEGWHHGMSTHAKIPIYFMLGTTLSFSVIFGFGEIVNICAGGCMDETAAPVLNSPKQILVLVILASIMGAVEGIIFGTLDAEDDIYLRGNFQRTTQYCMPLGGSVGFLMGFVNESLRHQPTQADQVDKTRTDPYQSI
eukprot:TRINITY_DN8930_c0_g1_i2.p1 TRINITY_DN8930_c0_g1~~TRINITY_DN8930_c0_g1_i2.p1  ORF type:complete len:245 (+),score=52.90 TRINITY_DN8930_c0_g1_i2:213-947(+)